MVYEPEENDVTFVCTECRSDQTYAYLRRSGFAKEGLAVPCQYCGGVTIETLTVNRDAALRQALQDRGLSY